MKQIPTNISAFKKGDIITRISPAEYPGGDKEYNYIGKKFRFLGILNSLIYLELDYPKQFDMMFFLFGGEPAKEKKREMLKVELPFDIWQDGWSFYIEPNFDEGENQSEMTLKEIQIRNLEVELKNALEKEDYNDAARINGILNNLKNNLT